MAYVVCKECGARWESVQQPRGCITDGCEATWMDLPSFALEADADRCAASLARKGGETTVDRLVREIASLGKAEILALKIRLAREWNDDDDPDAGVREPLEPLPHQPGGAIAHPLPVDPRLVKYRPGWP